MSREQQIIKAAAPFLPDDLSGMLQAIREYCTEEEQEVVDLFLQITEFSQMMEMAKMMMSMMGGDESSDGDLFQTMMSGFGGFGNSMNFGDFGNAEDFGNTEDFGNAEAFGSPEDFRKMDNYDDGENDEWNKDGKQWQVE